MNVRGRTPNHKQRRQQKRKQQKKIEKQKSNQEEQYKQKHNNYQTEVAPLQEKKLPEENNQLLSDAKQFSQQIDQNSIDEFGTSHAHDDVVLKNQTKSIDAPLNKNEKLLVVKKIRNDGLDVDEEDEENKEKEYFWESASNDDSDASVFAIASQHHLHQEKNTSSAHYLDQKPHKEKTTSFSDKKIIRTRSLSFNGYDQISFQRTTKTDNLNNRKKFDKKEEDLLKQQKQQQQAQQQERHDILFFTKRGMKIQNTILESNIKSVSTMALQVAEYVSLSRKNINGSKELTTVESQDLNQIKQYLDELNLLLDELTELDKKLTGTNIMDMLNDLTALIEQEQNEQSEKQRLENCGNRTDNLNAESKLVNDGLTKTKENIKTLEESICKCLLDIKTVQEKNKIILLFEAVESTNEKMLKTMDNLNHALIAENQRRFSPRPRIAFQQLVNLDSTQRVMHSLMASSCITELPNEKHQQKAKGDLHTLVGGLKQENEALSKRLQELTKVFLEAKTERSLAYQEKNKIQNNLDEAEETLHNHVVAMAAQLKNGMEKQNDYIRATNKQHITNQQLLDGLRGYQQRPVLRSDLHNTIQFDQEDKNVTQIYNVLELENNQLRKRLMKLTQTFSEVRLDQVKLNQEKDKLQSELDKVKEELQINFLDMSKKLKSVSDNQKNYVHAVDGQQIAQQEFLAKINSYQQNTIWNSGTALMSEPVQNNLNSSMHKKK